MADFEGEVGTNFYAFVKTKVLPLPLLDELELGQVVAPPPLIDIDEMILFTVGTENTGFSDIYAMAVGADDAINLTNHNYDDFAAAWSATAGKIAFISCRDTPVEPGENDELDYYCRHDAVSIYMMNPDGSEQQFLASYQAGFNDPVGYLQPVWSPDGSMLVYWDNNSLSIDQDGYKSTEEPYYPYIIEINNPQSRRIEHNLLSIATSDAPSWSPDSNQIAVIGSDDQSVDNIFLIDIDDGSIQNLTGDFTDEYLIQSNAQWSPDGETLIFNCRYDATGYICAIDHEGDSITLLGEGIRASWSHDGMKIAYFGLENYSAVSIRVMDADGSNDTAIWSASDAAYAPDVGQGLHWSADDSHLAFIKYANPNRVFVIDADGNNETDLYENGPGGSDPVWIP